MHNIPLAKLKKIINPFDEAIEKFSFIVKNEDIKSKLYCNDIFTVAEDGNDNTIRHNHLRKIAYHVANSVDSIIYVKLTDIHKAHDIVIDYEDNIYKYAAAIYRGDKNINIELESSVRDAKVLLGLKLIEPSIIDSFQHDKVIPAYWRIVEEKFDDWNDPEKILNYIHNENFLTYYSYINKSLWHHEDFLLKIRSKISLDKIPYQDKLNPSYISLMCSSDSFFSEFKYFEAEYQLFLEHKSSYPELMQIIQEKTFFSEEFLIKNIKSIEQKNSQYIPDSIKFSDNFLSSIYHYHTNYSRSYHSNRHYGYDPILDEYVAFKKAENNSSNNLNSSSNNFYWLDLKDAIWKDRFFEAHSALFIKNLVEYPERMKLESYKKLIDHWIDVPEAVMTRIKSDKGIVYNGLAKFFPDSVKNSFDYCYCVMNFNGNYYHHLPEEFKNNVEFLHKGLDSLKSNMRIPHSILKNIVDPSILNKLFSYGLYTELKRVPQFPEEILYDPRYVCKVPLKEAAYHLKYDRKFKAALEQSPDRIYELVKNEDISDKLSVKYKNDDTVFLHMLCSHYKYTLKNIDYSRFCSKDFCIKALKHNTDLTKNIPALFWQDRQFVSHVFDLVDKQEISSYLIDRLPKEIKEVLTHYKIEENYKNFFDNYQLHINFEKDNYQDQSVVRKRKI